MKKIVRVSEKDLTKILKKLIKEEESSNNERYIFLVIWNKSKDKQVYC